MAGGKGAFCDKKHPKVPQATRIGPVATSSIPDPAANPLRQAEAALRDSEERLRLAVEAGQLGIWDWDIVTGRVTWSDRVYAMHEMAPGSDTGGFEGFKARIHPEDRDAVVAAITQALADGGAYSAEFRANLPSGRMCWISTRAHLVRDAAGRPLRMVGASTDVTGRAELLAAERQARSEAEAAHRRMGLLAQAGAELARSLDPQDTLDAIARTVVPAIADWCRIDVLDEQGQLQRGIAHHSDPAVSARALQMARELRAQAGAPGSIGWVIERGEPYHGSFDSPEKLADPALRLYTQTFGMKAHFVIPLIARGRTIGALAVIQSESGRDLPEADRTLVLELGRRAALALDNARLYADASRARLQAENANRAKDEFLAVLGHELRNPLAPITTALALMDRRAPNTGVDERRIIGRQVRHLSRLIDDLLDISRITQGKVDLRREPLDLRTVAAHALEQTQPLFESRLDVRTQLPDAPLWVDGDAVRLAQVLCNLLVNAARFTPAGGRVTLSAARAPDGWVEAVVEDNGAGIGPQLLPRVFDAFVQGRQASDRRDGGLGLGLAIVRNLVELHGGGVGAYSGGEGQGSRFTVRLPPGPGPLQGAVQPAAAPPSAGCRVLIVDDNTDALFTTAEVLRLDGHDVRTAGDAASALALLTGFAPQVALLDIGLPGTDGYALAALMRRQAGEAVPRFVALTGYGRDNDLAATRAAGFDEHLVKPVPVDRLLALVSRLGA